MFHRTISDSRYVYKYDNAFLHTYSADGYCENRYKLKTNMEFNCRILHIEKKQSLYVH